MPAAAAAAPSTSSHEISQKGAATGVSLLHFQLLDGQLTGSIGTGTGIGALSDTFNNINSERRKGSASDYNTYTRIHTRQSSQTTPPAAPKQAGATFQLLPLDKGPFLFSCTLGTGAQDKDRGGYTIYTHMSNNPLDTLASEASSEAALAVEGGKRPAEHAPQEQEAQKEGNEEQSLEAEEAAGGPPLPPAGQEAAAVKPDLFHQEHTDSEPNGGAGEALHSEVLGGVGDAAMAAVDDRLDSKGEQALPHTNGYIDNAQDKAVGNEVDSTRVEDEGGRVPLMSTDVEQPTRQQVNGDASSQQPEPEQHQQQGEAILPAPGADKSVPMEQIDEQQQQAPANGLPHLNGHGHEGVNGTAQSPSAQPSTSTLHDEPGPAEARSQDQPPLPMDALLDASDKSDVPSNEGGAVSTVSQPLPNQQQPPLSMDALPDDPAPLPSQLVQGHAPTSTDIHQNVTASSLPQDEQQQSAPRSPFTSGEPTIPANAERVPQTHPATMSGLSADLASPSLAKRPFEPDTEDARARDYFGEAIEEPSSKRQKLTPPPPAASGAEQSTEAPQQALDDAATGPPAGVQEQNSLPGQTVDHPEIQFGMDDMGEKAGEADAEGEPEIEADQSSAAPFGDASMADQTIDQSVNQSMVS